MRDVREALGLPPVNPDILKRFGAPTYTEEQVRAYAGYCEPSPEGEGFLEFKEALSDLRSLRQEHADLNGGGPGWASRWDAAWAKANELFANEDEAAYDRQQEDFNG